MGVKKYIEDKIKTTTKRLDEKTEFIAVDFFRLLFAIGIVALHLAPMQDINETLNYFVVHVLTRLGVPFFFLVSGFFLQKKIQDVQKVKAYLARIFQLYVIYTVLYLPQIVYDYRKAGGFWGWNLLDFVRNFHLAKHLRSLSVLYFGLHKWIEFYFVGLLHRALGVELNSLARFVLVVVLNYIAAEVIIRMSAIRHFQWLRKLY